MTWLPPLLVAIPLLSAAAIAGGDHVTPQPVQKAVAVAAAGATTGLAVVLMLSARTHELVLWFGGWHPRHGVALGIDFAVDPLAAAMCATIGGVVLLAILYSLTYMKEAARLFEALMLVALGAMCGFAMAGDIFNMFVWLELMGVAAYALTGFKADQLGPVQGAVNFAIVNSIGGYLFAIGIALLYARTGALNLAQIGQALEARRPDGLVIVALTLCVGALLTKGAAVPFHLWAADAYAVAPAPVCAMFGAVMTDIGLVGVARLYWSVFDAPFGAQARTVGDLLLCVGVVTALLAGVMALLQRHLKRMLAYSVVAHIGIMLAGIGLLGAKGLAGTAVMFLANAFLTAALFLTTGIVLAERSSIDELVLRRRPRRDPFVAAAWFAATIGLAGLPYVGTYLGHSLIDEAAAEAHRGWAVPLLWLASALVTAALLRAGARAFLGAGPRESRLLGDELEEEPVERNVLRPLLVLTTVAALLPGLVASLLPGIGERALAGAERFRDRAGYVARVLHGVPMRTAGPLPYAIQSTTLESLLYGVFTVGVAAALAALALGGGRLPQRLRTAALRTAGPPVTALKELHSGVVGDYVAWLLLGIAVFGGVWALALR